jgi:hypothetical protein
VLILYRYEIVPWWGLLVAVVIDVANALAALALILTMARGTPTSRSDTGAHDAEE